MTSNRAGGGRDVRAVAPVVAVVMMLGITIAMAAIVLPFMLTQTDQVEDTAPDVNVAFTYTEDVELDEEDSLGVTGEDPTPDADGKITVVLESGPSIPASQLRVNGTTSSGNLVDVSGSEFGPNDEVSSGTEVTVWANRGDTIDFIWTSEDEGESAILGTFTVRPTD